ncbi:1588_t:CDS:2 [Acaulospora colombiana]|uniref:1588_t:CDS:1 n=1 Tax=Acaulospora colombiana TaxID=27376 RepID=A0ACA9LL77_9GLOM|nr:1588_t:CDS:2 [Acaulospora colombiana]
MSVLFFPSGLNGDFVRMDRLLDVPYLGAHQGPPTVITVSAPSTTDTATITESNTSSDTQKPSDPPTNPESSPSSTVPATTSSEVVVTTTDGPLISISLPPLIPDPTTDTTTTSDTPVQTPDPTPTTTDGPLISISLSVDLPITDPPVDPSTSSSTSEPPVETPPTDGPSSSSTISVPQDPDPPVSNSNTVTVSSTTSGGVLDPTDVFPTQTASIPSITTTIIDSTSRPPLTIETEYDFLSATTLVLDPNAVNATSTTSVTITDPDEVATPTTIPTGGAATTLTMPSIPSTIPMFITPPPSTDPVAADSTIDGSEKIAILFQKSTLSWKYVLSSSETAGQILAYLPSHVASILELLGDDVKVVGLQAFIPDDYRTENDLMTLFVAFLPSDKVSTLASMIRTLSSPFYQTDNAVAKAIAQNVVASYDIASLEGVNNENGSSTTPSSNNTKTDNSRRNAIIGVTVTFGIIALVVLIWWGVRTYRTRREGMHKRLSYGGTANYGATGRGMTEVGGYTATRAESPPMLHNPFMTEREREEEARGIRRNSFYAIGPDDASIEEETFDYLSHRNSTYSGGVGGGATALHRSGSGGSGGARWGGGNSNNGHGQRRLVVGQPISQPILRESSMGNW